MAQRALTYLPVSEQELDLGVEHARREYDHEIDRDMLRMLVNDTLANRTPKVILPFLAATIVRKHIPLSNREKAPKIEAFKGAIMKIMSARAAWIRADAKKRQQGRIAAKAVSGADEHPEDPQHKGQFLLI